MSNPPSFRLPIPLPPEDEGAKVHPQVAAALRYLFNGITDLQQANIVTNGKIKAASTTTAAASETANSIGKVNNQNGQSAVMLQQADYGALVKVSNGGGVAVSLNSGVQKPYYSRIQVDSSSGNAILTPTSGTINGAGFLVVPGGGSVNVFYNSTDNNWSAS